MDAEKLKKDFVAFIRLIELQVKVKADYHEAKKRHDETSAQRYMRQLFAIEKRVKEAIVYNKEQISVGFQQHLFS